MGATWRASEPEFTLSLSRARGCACLVGRVDEARTVAAEMLRRYPKETISAFLTREPWTDPVYRAGQDREIAGMRLAGIPD
jgi:hypothetical protein